MRAVLSSLCLIMSTTGCYSWTEVKPTELPKLNGGGVSTGRVVSGQQRGEIVAVSVSHLERPDGTLLEVNGEPDIRITNRSGTELEFDHPTEASVADGALMLRGENRANTKLMLSDIASAEVSEYDGVMTMLLYLGGLVVVTGGTFLIVSD